MPLFRSGERVFGLERGQELPHKVGETVVYRNGCIYRVDDIRSADLGTGERLYYVLRPVFEERSLTYVPVDSDAVGRIMRPVLSRDEIDRAIADAEQTDLDWPADSKKRAEAYERIIVDGDPVGTLKLFKKLSEHKAAIEKMRKKLYASDARILASAEKAVTEEFAFSLGIQRSEVLPYIRRRVAAGA